MSKICLFLFLKPQHVEIWHLFVPFPGKPKVYISPRGFWMLNPFDFLTPWSPLKTPGNKFYTLVFLFAEYFPQCVTDFLL